METPETAAHDLDEVRSELRRLGYLNHGFGRFLLQDALRPQRPWPTLLRLTLKVGLLAGLVLAIPLALGLVIANAAPEPDPLDVALDTLGLFLHLFLPISAAVALGFLVLCGIVLAVLRFSHVKRIETLSLAVSLLVGALGLLLALQGVRMLLAESQLPVLVALGLAAPVAIYLLIKLVYHGLLTLAIRFTDTAPGGRLFSRRWLGWAILAGAFLLTLPAVLSARRSEAPPAPAALPVAPGERVLLIGIDGVLPEELDYLLALGDLPTLASLARGGAQVWSYPRKNEPPAAFWTTIATGVPGPDHGVASLDSFRPLGVRTPLARNGPLRGWWSGVEVPLGLAEYRPLLANRRDAFTVWELASRGGAPVLAVNWWATFPAEEVPGLVVAHGAWQLLQDGAEGAVAPAEGRSSLTALARGAARPVGDGTEARLAAALPAEERAGVLRRALIPDRFYRQVFERELARQPRAAALYLPALDIAADGWKGGDVAFADLVRAELRAADQLLGRSLSGIGTVAIVLDPGRRRHAGGGRIVLWRRGIACGAPRPRGASALAPEAVASALLRTLGLPQSEQLPVPPAVCLWPEPPLVITGYGERGQRPTQGPEGREYLESLRSLGYL